MNTEIESASTIVGYWTYAAGIAGLFYVLAAIVGPRHTSPKAKAALSDFLLGKFDSNWSIHFCNLFDRIFGEKTFSWKRLLRSTIASLITVLILYVLFGEVLGVLRRAEEGMPFLTVMLFGALINTVPDYVSLIETRWILRLFQKTESFFAHLLALIVDLIFSGLIIWLAISLFRVLIGADPISVVEVFALFSSYSIFFYSTFLTSVLAWLYFITTWFVRLFSRTPLRKFLDVENRPEAQIGLVGAVIVFVVVAIFRPVVMQSENQDISRFDNYLCERFPAEICPHVARMSADVEEILRYLEKACEGGSTRDCIFAGLFFLGDDDNRAKKLLTKGCDAGSAISCDYLGALYYYGYSLDKDYEKAITYYKRACESGSSTSCANLASVYVNPIGTEPDYSLANHWFRIACDRGISRGCLGIGQFYYLGNDTDVDYEKAAGWFDVACDMEDGEGCRSAGKMYWDGVGVDRDDTKAFSYLERSCELDNSLGCQSLANFYSDGSNHTPDHGKAAVALEKACDLKNYSSCFFLGLAFDKGIGVDRDMSYAISLYERACEQDPESRPIECSEVGLYCMRGYKGVCEYRKDLINKRSIKNE